MTTTRLALEQLLSEAIGDYLEFDTTTNIGAGLTILSTDLKSYDGGQDDYFIDWWVSFQEGVNIAVAPRQVSDYATATGTLTVRGVNLGAEAGAVTIRLHRYNPNNKWKSLNRATGQLFPTLFKPLDNQILVTGNILPNGHFEDWAATTIPDFYTVTNATAVATTTAGLFRGGGKSAKVTLTVGNGSMILDSNNYPALLDLMGKSVSLYVWAYPEVADDAYVTIYTIDRDASTQTFNSTTACAADKWTLLKLENQTLNNNLVQIQIRFHPHTNLKYAYFDDAVLVGMQLREYALPSDFQDGVLTKVEMQYSGYPDIPCYEFHPRFWTEPLEHRVIRDGDYSSSSSPPLFSRLQLYGFPSNYYRMRLIGFKPLETLAADTSTIYLDGEKLDLIVAKAARQLFGMERGPISSQDKGRFTEEIAYWDGEVRRLTPRLMMQRPHSLIQTGE